MPNRYDLPRHGREDSLTREARGLSVLLRRQSRSVNESSRFRTDRRSIYRFTVEAIESITVAGDRAEPIASSSPAIESIKPESPRFSIALDPGRLRIDWSRKMQESLQRTWTVRRSKRPSANDDGSTISFCPLQAKQLTRVQPMSMVDQQGLTVSLIDDGNPRGRTH